MNHILILLLGIAAAGIGGKLFIQGMVNLSHRFQIAPGLMGLTLAAFATSAPELTVAIAAARAETPQISFGNVLGSNIVNVSFVLGLALLISPIHCSRQGARSSYFLALSLPLLIIFFIFDGMVSRAEGGILLAVFFLWLGGVIWESRHHSPFPRLTAAPKINFNNSLLRFIAGLILLFGAGKMVVRGAYGIALTWGVSEFVVGAILVAIGTCVPEIATTITAKLKGYDDVGLGTILGSNIFNSLFIVAVAALICPIVIDREEVIICLVVGFISVFLIWPSANEYISRGRGVVLLLIYGFYLYSLAP